MVAEGRLPAVDDTFTIEPLLRARIPGKHRAGRPDGGHQVQLEGEVPVGVGQLLELSDVGAADIVDETVDAPERRLGRGDELVGGGRMREIGCDVQVADPLRPAARRDDARALVLELACDREPDAAGGAGDDADLVLESELHAVATLAA